MFTYKLAAALSAWGQPQLALRFSQLASRAWRGVLHQTPNPSKLLGMLAAISDLGEILCFFGEWNTSATLARLAWTGRRAMLGPQHADTLTRWARRLASLRH